MSSRLLVPSEAPSGDPCPPELLVPKLVAGETTQAIMTTTFIPSQIVQEPFNGQYNVNQIKGYLSVTSFHTL
jgi:hypothetical protein